MSVPKCLRENFDFPFDSKQSMSLGALGLGMPIMTSVGAQSTRAASAKQQCHSSIESLK